MSLDAVEVAPGCKGRVKLVTCNLGLDSDGVAVKAVLTRLFLTPEARSSFSEFILIVNGTCDPLLTGAPVCELPESLDLGDVLLPQGGGGDVVEVEARNHSGVVRTLKGGLEMKLVRIP
jgi:hypothetical protein